MERSQLFDLRTVQRLLYASPPRLIDAEPAIEHPELRRPSSGKLNWSPEREKGRLGETSDKPPPKS
jgi:hypothetical protein